MVELVGANTDAARHSRPRLRAVGASRRDPVSV